MPSTEACKCIFSKVTLDWFLTSISVSDHSNDMTFDYQTTPRKGGNINPDPIVWKAPKTPPRRTDIKIGTPNSVSLMVFLGGIPWDIDEKALVATFRQFGKNYINTKQGIST